MSLSLRILLHVAMTTNTISVELTQRLLLSLFLCRECIVLLLIVKCIYNYYNEKSILTLLFFFLFFVVVVVSYILL